MISFDSEQCFEDLLFDNSNILVENFAISPDAKILRQVSLYPYGICDLLSVSKYKEEDTTRVYIDLFELKNTPIKSDHIIQCARYKTFFDNLDEDDVIVETNFHLIGMATFKNNPSDLVYLCQSIDWLNVYECTLDPLNGIEFKYTSGWGISKKGEGHKTKFDEKIISTLNELNQVPIGDEK